MGEALSTAGFSELIGSIYDCALDPSHWEPTLDAIKSLLQCTATRLALVDLRQHRVLIQRTLGMEARFIEAVSKQHLCEIIHFIETHLDNGHSIDGPLVTSRLLSPAVVAASPYFQETAFPFGIVDIAQTVLIRTPTRLSGLGFGRPKSAGAFGDPQIELLRLLIPHIRRAVTISNVLDARTIERSRMTEALDGLRCAVILSDDRGAVLHANRAAEKMLSAGALVTAREGILMARSASAAAELRTAIAQAARNEADIGKTGLATRLTEPDVPPIFAHVLPMTGSELRTRLQPTAAAALFIGALPDEDDAADLMTAAFGLTSAEKRVLASLLAGRTLAETAAVLGVAQSTAKSQLERVFSKTGVSRQADLILLATRLTPPTELPS